MSIPRSRDLRLLAGAAGLSALGDFMAIFPLILHVQQRTGSAFAVSALIFALWGPVVLAAGLAGAIVDRFENRRILIAVSLGQAAVVSRRCSSCVDNLWALLAADDAAGLRRRAEPAGRVRARPRGSRTEHRRRAGQRADGDGALGRLHRRPARRRRARRGGPPVARAGAERAVVRRRGGRGSCCCALGVARARAAAPRARCAPATGSPSSLRERDLAVTLGGAVAALALFSISATAEPFFVTDVLGAGSLAYGVLLTSWTVGMAAGSAGLAHRVGRARLAAGGLVAIVVQGLGIAGGALSSVLWMALIGFSVGGVAHGVKNVLLRTLIHERAPEALRGRAFAAYNGARNGAELGALVLGGIVVGALGARTALLVAGLGPALIGATCSARSHAPPRRGGAHHKRRESAPCTHPGMSSKPMVMGEYEGRQIDAGAMRIAFESMPAQFPPDESPFKGLPDDRCQCDHWGYLFKGSFRVTYKRRARRDRPRR